MKISFLFPGQGLQFIGMANDYYSTFSCFKNVISEISDYSKKNISSLISKDTSNLKKSQNSQIAIFAVCLGIFSIFKEENIQANFYIGHSFGEIISYTASNVFDKKTGTMIVLKRGQLIEKANEKNEGSMLAITGINKSIIQNLCETVSKKINPVYIAAFNSPNQIVISGYNDSINYIRENIFKYQGKAFLLNIQGALHTPILGEVKDELESFLKDIPINNPEVPIYSSLEGLEIKAENIKKSIAYNIVQPVLWQKMINNLLKQKVTIFVEISPKNILQNILKKFSGHFQILGTENLSNLKKTLNILNNIRN